MGVLQKFDVSFNLAPSEEPTLPGEVYDGFEIKSIEVERVYAAGGSTATVELIYTEDVSPDTIAKIAERDHQPDMEIRLTHTHHEPENERPPAPSDRAEVIGGEITGSARQQVTTKSTRHTVYTGTPIRVVGKKNGVVKMKLLDRRLLFNRNYVSLDTTYPEGTGAKTIIRDLLVSKEELDIDPLSASEYQEVLHSSDRSARKKDVVVLSDLIPDYPMNLRYGGEEPITLFRVLSDLAYRTGMHFFIDRFNNIRFEGYPGKQQYIPAYVTDVKAGNEEDPSNVLVSSPFDDTGVSFFGSNSSSDVSSEVDVPGSDEGRKLLEKNVRSAREADSIALSGYMTDQLSRNYGKITILGEPLLSIYDGIVLGVMPDLAPVNNGLYTSKVIRHKINGSDGFLTEIELGEDIGKMYNKVKQSSERASEISRNVEEEGAIERGIRIGRDAFTMDEAVFIQGADR